MPPDSEFVTSPLWKKFRDRPIWVLSLSEREHRLRDALALIAIRDFLPPERSGQTTYATITLDETGMPVTAWPKIPATAGIVVLGRPSLFGPSLRHIQSELVPRLGYRLASDDPQNCEYRTIVVDGVQEQFRSPSFTSQRAADPHADELYDHGIVYSGWYGEQPVMLVSGTSTVGTWGCVKYVTARADCDDPRSQGDPQGVIRAFVPRGDACFLGRPTKH